MTKQHHGLARPCETCVAQERADWYATNLDGLSDAAVQALLDGVREALRDLKAQEPPR